MEGVRSCCPVNPGFPAALNASSVCYSYSPDQRPYSGQVRSAACIFKLAAQPTAFTVLKGEGVGATLLQPQHLGNGGEGVKN